MSGSDDSTRRRRPRRPRHPDPLANLAQPGNVWVAHWRKEGRDDEWIIDRIKALAEADGPLPRTPFGALDIFRLTERQLLWVELGQRLKAYADRYGIPPELLELLSPATVPALPSAASTQQELPARLDPSNLPVPKGEVPAGTPSSTEFRAAAAANFAARPENQGRGQRWLYEKYKRSGLWPQLSREEFPKQPAPSKR